MAASSIETSYGLVSPMAQARFWSKVGSAGESGCRHWQGQKNVRSGYGYFALHHGHMVRAHKLAYELTQGPVPAGMDLCHTCDIRACIEPSHLFVGTRAENMQDATLKDRVRFGSACRQSKVSEDEVRLIRADYAAGGVTQAELGRRCGLNQGTVSRLIRGENYRRVA